MGDNLRNRNIQQAFSVDELTRQAYGDNEQTPHKRFPSRSAQQAGLIPDPQRPGYFQFGNFHLTPSGLEVKGTVAANEYIDFGRRLADINESVQLWIGDWIIEGELLLNMTYKQLAAAIGRDPISLKNYKYVASSFQRSLRRDRCKFSHYLILAKRDDRAQWVEQVHNNEWSVAELRRQLDEYDNHELPPTPSPVWLEFDSFHALVLSKTEGWAHEDKCKLADYLEDLAQRLRG